MIKIDTGVGILIFILILGLVVFVHELGHFLMARRGGIFVEEFAMGMGPKLVTFKGKKKTSNPVEGQEDVTLYTLRALPIGGFCKMRGMEESIPDDPEAMNNKSVFSRILVIAGGSAMNFLLAVVLFFILVFLTGYITPVATAVQENSPAHHAGLQVGDRITHINGSRVSLWENFRFMLDTSGGNALDVRVIRDGTRVNLIMTPVRVAVQIAEGEYQHVYRIGMNALSVAGFLTEIPEGMKDYERTGIWGSFVTAVDTIIFHVRTPFRIIARFATRQPLPEGAGVASIVGIGADVTAIYQEAIRHGILTTVLTMMQIAAVLSAAIGIMNLLPIPALDGARLVFLVIEGIRRKPVSREREGMVHMIGFVLLIILLVVVTSRDIARLL